VSLIDTARKSDELEKAVRRAGLIKKYCGRIMVVGPNSVDRTAHNFADHKAGIVAMLNETAKAVAGVGVTAALHQLRVPASNRATRPMPSCMRSTPVM